MKILKIQTIQVILPDTTSPCDLLGRILILDKSNEYLSNFGKKFIQDLGRMKLFYTDPEKAAKIHGRTGQHPGNNVPCTMCGGACVYLMLPQQRKYEKNTELQHTE